MSNWVWGYLFGLAFIAIFSKERLNRAEHLSTTGSRRDRLLGLIVPGQLRRGPVFWRGVAIYFGILALAYTVFAFASSIIGPPLAKLFGIDAEPSDPIFPIAIALTIIGLTPQWKVVAKIERDARRMALSLVDIPKNFHDFADRLCAVRIEPNEIPPDLLDPSEAKALRRLLERAEASLGHGNDYRVLEQSAIKLWAFREWMTDQTAWPPHSVRSRFDAVQQELTPGVLAVLEDLEHLPREATGADESRLAAFRRRWKSVSERASQATDDICALFALYAEQAEGKPERDNPISNLLRVLIERARQSQRSGASAVDSLLLVIATTLAIAFGLGLYGVWAGLLRPAGADGGAVLSGPEQFSVVSEYVLEMSMLLFPAAIIGVVSRKGWRNAFDARILPARKLLWRATKAGIVVFVIYSLFLLASIYQLHERQFGADLRGDCILWEVTGVVSRGAMAPCRELMGYNPSDYPALAWNGLPKALLGALAALLFALVVDSRTAMRPRPVTTSALIGVGALALAGLHHVGNFFIGSEVSSPVMIYLSLSVAALGATMLVLTAIYVPRHYRRDTGDAVGNQAAAVPV